MHIAIVTVLKRTWVPVVIASAVGLGAISVNHLRGAFGSEPIFSATGSSAEPLVSSTIKRVRYEIYGPSGTTGAVNYLDENAVPRQEHFVTLPWAYTIETTVPAVIASVVAQGDSSVLGCRITVNGVLEDERSADGHHAQTSCLVKAA
ncbi:putative membrane protein mmpS4 [Mycobacteroides franklinii]|uniref:Putative membrane protein mmpS4 n=1 Tax=Mycobacteroides franklinii TaxID=948102 RepID=A0A4R8R2V5_9MYCO|nr:putative membrane protein mmpS4 [Mycobacteroides franklinii]TDZ47297.1 putative membrane protein mmpS4 [Mycobacteroides franklinii]TDZ57963.1 putative membrane protein mmpS4 [Mycobacteroides franklinii]TDZ64905.1 putative membrane protein mmpS4 [Mycobacteroides franklinii]TDZ71303.1 putative membrane protein mmpS4 [Mycobacteroides franklinii]